MDFAALPPEINSTRMYAGAGSGPMLAAAAAWDGLAGELHITASSYASEVSRLTSGWQGPSSALMGAAAAPYVAWMNTTGAQAEQAATQAKAAASAYESAFAMTVPPPVIAANRAQLMALVATNLLGQNTPAIAATEAHYGEMWAQDAAAMYTYAGSSAAASTLTPFTPPKPTTNPAGSAGQSATVAQATGTRAATTLHSAVPQALQALAQPVPSTSPTTGLSQVATSSATSLASSGATAPMSMFSGLTGASGKSALKGASKSVGAGASVLPAVAGVGSASSVGLFEDTLGLGLDGVGFAALDGGGLGVDFGGLGLDVLGADSLFETEGIAGFGGLGALGGAGGLGHLGALGGLGGAGLGPLSGIGSSGASSAGIGQAASVGALSVPPGWAAAAPSALAAAAPRAWTAAAPAGVRQVALASAEFNAEVASGVAASESEIPYAEMALAGTAGRAMLGTAGRARRERPGATTRARSLPPRPSLSGPVAIAAELRELAELRDRGILTEEEFSQQKQRLLGGN